MDSESEESRPQFANSKPEINADASNCIDQLEVDSLGQHDIDQLLARLGARKRQLSADTHASNSELLLVFLEDARAARLAQVARLHAEIDALAKDIALVAVQEPHGNKRIKLDGAASSKETLSPTESQFKRISTHLPDLQANYFSKSDISGADCDDAGRLSSFAAGLDTCSKYSYFKTLANLYYADSFLNTATSIVSSIEFDKNDEFFAIAGVTRKIKIFDFDRCTLPIQINSSHVTSSTVIDVDSYQNGTDQESDSALDPVQRYPVREMTCNSKVSCLSWNTHTQATLLSSDYEGIISIWDVSQALSMSSLDEHEKRVWSVDFSHVDPMRFASGGDDTKGTTINQVKIWNVNQKRSALTLATKANVCSVRFHPTISHQFAFGSADHGLHYYDLRNISQPLMLFQGHARAVSYVKFLDGDHIVTASTDSSLCLWSLSNTETNLVRRFSGHFNEKNFVGLAVNSNSTFIACGSESNSAHIYYAKTTKPILTHAFGNAIDSMTGELVKQPDPQMFVSSVCFKRKTSNVLVCANSQGRIKILEMK